MKVAHSHRSARVVLDFDFEDCRSAVRRHLDPPLPAISNHKRSNMNRPGVTTGIALLVISFGVTTQAAHALDRGKIDGRARVDEKVDDPNGEYYLKELNGQSYLKLSGRVGRLRIGKIDGQSTLDASCLDAAEVVVEDKIDGQSDLIVHTSSFRFREINGQSLVVITHSAALSVRGRKIDGQSRIFHRGTGEADQNGDLEVNGSSRILRLCE